MSVALDARFLMLYTGGISNPPMCSSEELDHAVLLVGYGTETTPPPNATGKPGDSVDFWLVKNSWTENWGAGGGVRQSLCCFSDGVAKPSLCPRSAG